MPPQGPRVKSLEPLLATPVWQPSAARRRAQKQPPHPRTPVPHPLLGIPRVSAKEDQNVPRDTGQSLRCVRDGVLSAMPSATITGFGEDAPAPLHGQRMPVLGERSPPCGGMLQRLRGFQSPVSPAMRVGQPASPLSKIAPGRRTPAMKSPATAPRTATIFAGFGRRSADLGGWRPPWKRRPRPAQTKRKPARWGRLSRLI